jgi:enoyl-CoA hydratase/carnithine racemase
MSTAEERAAAETTTEDLGGVTLEVRGAVLLIGLDRPAKRNALSPQMLDELAVAYARYEADDALRCAVLFGHGKAFSAGADLIHLKRAIEDGELVYGDGQFDPFSMTGERLSKPVVAGVHGMCFAGGMEVALAADIIIAAEDTMLGQPEVRRGLFAFGGGAVRWAQRVGWGNAQRHLLTGDSISAEEALRIGLVQEVVPGDRLRDRAFEIAEQIAGNAPIGVRDTLAVGRIALSEGADAAFAELARRRESIVRTGDAAEGVASFLEKRDGHYQGR